MDIRTLPEIEREIYNNLRSRYKLYFEPLQLGDDTVRLLKIADLEELLNGRDPFANVSEFPFWVKLWEAARALATVLHQGMAPGGGRRLLELGAGLGAPGMAAALNGYDVTITDYEEIILDFQRVSIAASGLTGSVHSVMLDWLNPPEMAPFDVLVGAEILFREEFFQPLIDIFATSLKPGGVILLAHDASRQSLDKFLKLASRQFIIDGQVKKYTREQGDVTIILNRLRQRSSADVVSH
ncbi:MAG: class I SAM-dependent methyltransferase [Desulfopila sp.]